MKIQSVIKTVNQMQADGIIDRYAIGGAVGATFYLEAMSTLDVDIFVSFQTQPGSLLVSPKPIFDYLGSLGYSMQGEYVMIAEWPVQFLAPTGALRDEALAQAVEADVEGTPAQVFSAEHLAAIALQTGRAKDKARVLQFMESGELDMVRFEDILTRHGLTEQWRQLQQQFRTNPS